MDVVDEDKELASEMIALLGKELKASKRTVKELEERVKTLESDLENARRRRSVPIPQIATVQDEWQERAEKAERSMDGLQKRAQAAEHAMEVLQKRVNEFGDENEALRIQLARQQQTSVFVKKEEPVDEKPFPSLRDISLSAESIGEDLEETENESGPATNSGNFKELEEALERYYGKYKSQKQSKTQWKEAYAELKKKVKDLEDERDGLRARANVAPESRSTAKKRAHETMVNDTEPPRPATQATPIQVPTGSKKRTSKGELIDLLSRCTKCDLRPPYTTLQPVAFKGLDLKPYLASDPKSERCSSNFLYVPDRVGWCTPERQHAFAVGPLWIYSSADRSLKKSDAFKGLYGQTFSLFYSWKHLVYYSGMYKALSLERHFGEGIKLSAFRDDVRMNAVADSAFQNPSEETDSTTRFMCSVLPGLYSHDIFKTEVLGLQCVGFDLGLYESLTARFRASQRSQEAVYPEPNQWPPQKKQKV